MIGDEKDFTIIENARNYRGSQMNSPSNHTKSLLSRAYDNKCEIDSHHEVHTVFNYKQYPKDLILKLEKRKQNVFQNFQRLFSKNQTMLEFRILSQWLKPNKNTPETVRNKQLL